MYMYILSHCFKCRPFFDWRSGVQESKLEITKVIFTVEQAENRTTYKVNLLLLNALYSSLYEIDNVRNFHSPGYRETDGVPETLVLKITGDRR